MLKFILPLFLLTSCLEDPVTEDCEELSMQKYKGAPLSSQKFEQKCQGVKVKYTKELCQEALAELMQVQSLSEVKKEFGSRVEGCFTHSDLERFNKLK